MTDAWIVTCEASDLLFASETACELLGRTPDELSALMHRKDGWPRTIRRIPRATGASGEARFDLDVPLKDGRTRPIHVQSHALPLMHGVRRSYISLLTPRDA